VSKCIIYNCPRFQHFLSISSFQKQRSNSARMHLFS